MISGLACAAVLRIPFKSFGLPVSEVDSDDAHVVLVHVRIWSVHAIRAFECVTFVILPRVHNKEGGRVSNYTIPQCNSYFMRA